VRGGPEYAQRLLGAGAHADTVTVLLQRVGWAYGWGETLPGKYRDDYYDVGALLVAAGGTVDPVWLADPDRGMPLVQQVQDDPRLHAALKWSN